MIALGGGSNIDIAKMAAILLKYGGTPPDYFGFDRVPGPVAPLIACPTTAGTGSEVSNSSVLTDHAAATKVSSLSHYLRPAAAIVDPDLTDSAQLRCLHIVASMRWCMCMRSKRSPPAHRSRYGCYTTGTPLCGSLCFYRTARDGSHSLDRQEPRRGLPRWRQSCRAPMTWRWPRCWRHGLLQQWSSDGACTRIPDRRVDTLQPR